MKIHTFWFLIFLLNFNNINAIVVKVMIFIMSTYQSLYDEMVKDFNNYMAEKKLNITLEFGKLTENDSTLDVNAYGASIDTLLKKRSTKYDVYVYFDIFNEVYAPHFIDLKNYLSEDEINNFPSELIERSTVNNRLIGLPCQVNCNILYSNKELLNKYEKEPPKTWEELIETGKYIYNEEKKANETTDLLIYNGLFSDDSVGNLSIYEVIHSLRSSRDAPYPILNSKETEEAIKLIKNLKDSVDIKNVFKSDINLAIEKLMDKKGIFINSYYLGPNPYYVGTAIPGRNNVFGTILSPSFVAVSRYVNNERQEAAMEFVKYYTSERVQKNFFMKYGLFSIIPSLYDDVEACQWVDCAVIKEASPYIFVGYDSKDYVQEFYYNKIREYAFKYIFENGTIHDTMKKLKDLDKKYYFSIKTDDSSIGLVLLITVCVSLTIMTLLVIIFSITKDYNNTFLPKDFWIISLYGSMFIQFTIFTLYGKLTVVKCFMKLIFSSTFYIINIVPIFNQLIVNIPSNNKFSRMLKKRIQRYFFLMAFIALNIILIGLISIKPYTIESEIIIDGESYEKCILKNGFSSFLTKIIFAMNVLILLSSLLLLFIEWGLKETFYHTRIIISLVFIDLLLFIIYKLFDYFKFKNYIIDGITLYFIIFFLSLSNFTLLFITKIYGLLFIRKKDSLEDMIDKLRENGQQFSPQASANTNTNISNMTDDTTTNMTSGSNTNQSYSSKDKRNISSMSVLMKYHYRKSITEG